ncbi:MAG TPA: FAD-dependent oxidoreductase [Vicinamibacterales bacterium]|nr:FAD-dependent oxidoreductase [Vicinamibacterales bacterium]
MRHVVVVGAGVFGVWAAHHLRASGARVTLVDAYGPASPRASSGDQSRILRCGYGGDEIYTRFARRSLEQWLSAARLPSERPIWYPCGVLWLAAAGDPYTAATRRTLEREEYPLDVIDADGLRARYPHLLAADLPDALLEPDGGVLMARRAVRALAAALVRAGSPLIRGRILTPAPGPIRSLRLADDREIAGDAFLFACGAWLPSVFPELLAGKIRPTRQTVVYFGTPAGDDRFSCAHTPAWIDFPAGIYGVPEIEAGGVKVGIDEHGPPIDPDNDDRIPDAAAIVKAREWLGRRFPDLSAAPVVGTRVCQYENTSTGDFLIDRHPDHDNVWIVGGGSGHGFKHGPAVGEHVANLVLTGAETNPRFALAGKSVQAQRAVF